MRWHGDQDEARQQVSRLMTAQQARYDGWAIVSEGVLRRGKGRCAKAREKKGQGRKGGREGRKRGTWPHL